MKLAVPDLIQFQKHLISSDIELHLHITIIIMILLHSFFQRGYKVDGHEGPVEFSPQALVYHQT